MITNHETDDTRHGDQRGPHAPKAGHQGPAEAVDSLADDQAEELLMDGQEEVFSRTEIESGRIEHHVGEEGAAPVSSSRPKSAA
ncbi:MULTISPECIES: hypothetical protein [unclassified Brevundimonas]|uniref:hypothetical protein n=1 Tax=unclassified Brevundimonas TaxID=2622653 RepID=UPI0025C4C7F0|nr:MULTISPECIES: hypothetical protein [unclassified Brevundimonas]